MFREIAAADYQCKPFRMIGTEWMLIGAEHAGRVNMMTAAWGGMGILWRRPVAFIFLRPSRFTKTLVDAAAGFSCTFYEEQYREQLNLCGSKSGRDLDKVAACNFTVARADGVPYFAEAHTAFLCEKLYRQPQASACFTDIALYNEHYKDGDYHELYVGEVKRILVKES